MALGSTQPLTEMSTRNIYLHSRLPNVMKCESLNYLETSGLVQACNRDCFNLLAFNIHLLYNAAFMFPFSDHFVYFKLLILKYLVSYLFRRVI